MGNLPQPRTRFIGRQDEIALARELLARNQLVTLTGAGGTGKTRLALAVATTLADTYTDDAWFVSCAAIIDPALVLPTVVQSLGLQVAGNQPPLAILVAHLAERHSLLVLDNLEQVIDVAPEIAVLLDACPHLTVLATSRVPLHLEGEQLLPVPPLDLIEGTAPSREEIEQAGAVALFVQRCQTLKPDFQLTDQTAPVVLEICRRLDGLPLAIELAAARVRFLSPKALLERLEQRLPLLAGGSRDHPARQQTIRDTIAWSYNLLHDEEQRLYRQLAVFVGGWTLEAAEACNPDIYVLDGLATLVDHSLVRQFAQPDGSTRFTMLETIREYGLEQLELLGEAPDAKLGHARFFLSLVELAGPELMGNEQRRWLGLLDSDIDNVRATLTWAIAHDAEAALLAVAALWQLWTFRVHPDESRRWVETALTVGHTAPAHARAKALDVAGNMVSAQGEYVSANAYFEASLEIFRELGDRRNVANTLCGMGRNAMGAGEFARADRLCSEGAAIFQEIGERWGYMRAIGNVGWNTLGTGEFERGHALLTESLAIARELGIASMVANYAVGLAFLSLERHDPLQAKPLLVEALELSRDLQYLSFIAFSLEGFGRVAALQKQPKIAARLIGAANALREQIGISNSQAFMDPQRDRDLAIARAQIDEDEFVSAWEDGQRITLDDAIKLALSDEPSTSMQDIALSGVATNLSPRELDVLRLIVDGKSDREIAAELFISHHTVMRHVSNILGKLGVESRTAAATYAIRHNLQ